MTSEILRIGIAILIALALTFGVLFIIQAVMFELHQVPVGVLVDEVEVYHGPNFCVTVESSGAATSVAVDGGFLCWWPMARYVSHNVKMIGDRRP